jgi:hypothetical protein
LDGKGPQPFEHFIGRLSEEFGGALPSVIWAELQRLPAGFLEQVIEYRSYAAAYTANELDPAGWQHTPMRTLAMEIEHDLANEEVEQKSHGG